MSVHGTFRTSQRINGMSDYGVTVDTENEGGRFRLGPKRRSGRASQEVFVEPVSAVLHNLSGL
jgi:hypothetical protein